MDKLKLAHEFMMKKMETETIDNHWELFYSSWRYADAMQAEADKCINKQRPDVLCEVDWSQAPDDATHYVIFADGLAYWYKAEKLECFDIAPSFGIVGLYVVERPHGF